MKHVDRDSGFLCTATTLLTFQLSCYIAAGIRWAFAGIIIIIISSAASAWWFLLNCNEYTLWCQPHLWHTCANFYIKSSCTMCLYSYVYIPKDLLPRTGSLSYCMKNNNRVYVYGKSKYLYLPGECWVSMTVWNSCQKHYIWQQAAATETSLRGRHLAAAHWLPALILGTYMIL